MTEFLNNIPKGNVQIGIVLITFLIIFVIVFALTFVPNPKDSHRKRELRRKSDESIISRHSIIQDIGDRSERNRRR